jgi:hypothetical protein
MPDIIPKKGRSTNAKPPDLDPFCPRGKGQPPETKHAPYRLAEKIVALSVAGNWSMAKLEWDLAKVFFADPDEPGTCLCGHRPIREHCVLVNRLNGNMAVVGNVCVTRFMGLASDRLFRSLRRIEQDRTRALSVPMVEHAYGQGWINDWERGFNLNTVQKRRLSGKQRLIRAQINGKVLARATEGRSDA